MKFFCKLSSKTPLYTKGIQNGKKLKHHTVQKEGNSFVFGVRSKIRPISFHFVTNFVHSSKLTYRIIPFKRNSQRISHEGVHLDGTLPLNP